ncbi:MAG: hypothetical protein EA392_10790 [Cryomorphaceae bacterium]|nr:MAG: hypothetical protein EA392_10790 [Cryomorphaceae bacterium]
MIAILQMKSMFAFIALSLGVVVGSVLIIASTNGTDKRIVGNWVEIDWVYEKVDAYDDYADAEKKRVPEFIKQSIGEQLIIHEAETWQFMPDGRLLLHKGDSEEVLQWRIKGRGHILQLKHDNNVIENFEIAGIDKENLYLHLETEVQARGIAKLIFKRI